LMQLHYLTLLRQVAFLHQELAGWEIIDAYSQLRNECRFILRGPEGEEKCLQCSSHPQYPYVLLLSVPKRKQNSAPILSELLGKRISSVSILHNERLIDVDFNDSDQRLVLQLFTNHTNFMVIDEEDQIVNAFKSQKKLTGSQYDPQPGDRLDPLAITEEDFLEHLNYNGQSLDSSRLRDFNLLSKPIIRELLFRSGISDVNSDVSINQIRNFYREMQAFLKACKSDNPVIYFNGEIPERFSLTTLRSEKTLKAEEFSDLNAALRLFNFRGLKYAVLGQRTRRLEQMLDRRLRSLQNSLSQMVAKPKDVEKSAELKKIGELLAVQPGKIPHGVQRITLIDYHDPEMKELEVTVNPNLSMHENARSYFQRAKKLEERVGQHEEQKEWLQKQLVLLNGFQERLTAVDGFKELEKLEKDMTARNLLKPRQDSGADKSISLPYKKYGLKDYEIWVGKNARQNDALTFKHAAKHDFWLHVQGYSGSHVVIRNPNRHDHPAEDVLEYAARLAVTNSKARHASYVPVVYTQIRYVRKPRKAAPGSVVPEMVKTIFVDPL